MVTSALSENWLNNMRILVLGGASYDEIIHVNEFFQPVAATIFPKAQYSALGSTGIGKAIAFKKLGYDVSFQAVIGKDIYGGIIETELKSHGIDFHPSYVSQTEKHTNFMNSHGDRISVFKTVEPDNDFDPTEFESLIASSDIVCLNIIDYCRSFIPVIKKHNKPIYCDLHDYDGSNPHHLDFLNVANGIQLSSNQMPDYESFMKAMIQAGKDFIVVTHGSKGASAIDKSKMKIDIPAEKVDFIDTNGAGDNFFAGFLHGYLTNQGLKNSLLMGEIAATDCILSRNIVGDNLSIDYLEKKLSKLKKNS